MKLLPPRGLALAVACHLFVGAFSLASSDAKELKLLPNAIDAGAGAKMTGLAFRVSSGRPPELYAADMRGNESTIRVFDVSSASEVASYPVGTNAYGVATGQGDFNPEILVSPVEGRILRKQGEVFQNALYPPFPVYGIASSEPYKNYSDVWAIAQNQTDVVKLKFASTAEVVQTIPNIGSHLTDLTTDDSGNLYVLGENKVYKYSDAGTLLETYELPGDLSSGAGITYDTTDATLWVSDGGSMIAHLAFPE